MTTGALWLLGTRWSAQVASTLTFVVLARLLAPTDFGLVAMAGVFVGFANAIISFGLGAWLIQRNPLRPGDADTVFWTSLGLSCFVTVAFVAVAPSIANLLNQPELAPVLWGLSATFPIAGLSAAHGALLQRDLQFRSLALRSLIATLSGLAVALVIAASGGGVWSLVAQALAQAAVSTAALWMLSPWRPRLLFSRQSWREAASFGIGVVVVGLLAAALQEGDAFFVGAFLGPEQAGQYALGKKIPLLILSAISGVIAAVSLPAFSRVRDDNARLNSIYLRAAGLSVAGPAVALVPLAVAAPDLIPLIFGPKWGTAGVVASALAIQSILASATWLDRSLIYASGHPRVEAGIMGLALVSVPVAVAIGSQFGGVVAVAVALAIRQVAFWPVRLAGLALAAEIDVWQVVKRVGGLWLISGGSIAVGYLLSTMLAPAGQESLRLVAAPVAALVYVLLLRITERRTLDDLAANLPETLSSTARRFLLLK